MTKSPLKVPLISPSILSADFARLGEEVLAVEKAGADWIHVDVMDGHFVPNLTLGAPVLQSLKPATRLPLDVHLMIEEPERYVVDFARAGATYLTFHIEASRDPGQLIQTIRKNGMRPGITLKPVTPILELKPWITLVDLVLVMTVNPGFSGQTFMHDQLEKVSQVRGWLGADSPTRLQVDGGINAETGRLCWDAGADVFVAGNAVFKKRSGGSYNAAINALKEMG